MYPKDILKLAWERHLIDDREVWLSYIDIRNSLSHSYDHTFAEKYYPHVLDSLRYFQALLEKIESGI